VLSLTGHGTRKDIHRSRFQRIRHAVTLRTSLLDYIISYVMAAPGAKFAIIDCLVCVFIRMQIQRTGFISCNSDTTYLSARLCSLESTPGFSPLTTYSHLSYEWHFFHRFYRLTTLIVILSALPKLQPKALYKCDYYYYYYHPSLFQSRFKTFLFCKSFPQ